MVKFFGSNGPAFPTNPFDLWTSYLVGNFNWATDPAYPTKLTARPSGTYTVGYDGPTTRLDIVYTKARMFNTSTFSYYDALGKAELPWKYTADAGSIVGTPQTVAKNVPFWVQASASLPAPIQYQWKVNNVVQPWTDSFVTQVSRQLVRGRLLRR